jgi:hypothetical protein
MLTQWALSLLKFREPAVFGLDFLHYIPKPMAPYHFQVIEIWSGGPLMNSKNKNQYLCSKAVEKNYR